MRYVSAILRILCGVAILAVAGYVYLIMPERSGSGDQPMELFGHQLNATPEMVTLIIGAFALIGLLLVVFGLVTIVRKPRASG